MSTRPKTIYLSSHGVQLFEKRLEDERQTHAQICEEREIAHELSGDGWHDNPDFNRLQQLEANSSWKIHELEEVLSNAQRVTITEGERPTESVQIGSVVKIEVYDVDRDKSEIRVIEVVGYQESNPERNCVSYDAPLASAIVGQSVGAYQEAKLGHRSVDIEVIELFKSRKEAGLEE